MIINISKIGLSPGRCLPPPPPLGTYRPGASSAAISGRRISAARVAVSFGASGAVYGAGRQVMAPTLIVLYNAMAAAEGRRQSFRVVVAADPISSRPAAKTGPLSPVSCDARAIAASAVFIAKPLISCARLVSARSAARPLGSPDRIRGRAHLCLQVAADSRHAYGTADDNSADRFEERGRRPSRGACALFVYVKTLWRLVSRR